MKLIGSMSEGFEINVGVRQGCALSPWLSTISLRMGGLLGGTERDLPQLQMTISHFLVEKRSWIEC